MTISCIAYSHCCLTIGSVNNAVVAYFEKLTGQNPNSNNTVRELYICSKMIVK